MSVIFCTREVEHAIKKLKTRKATVIDAIPAETFKSWPDYIFKILNLRQIIEKPRELYFLAYIYSQENSEFIWQCKVAETMGNSSLHESSSTCDISHALALSRTQPKQELTVTCYITSIPNLWWNGCLTGGRWCNYWCNQDIQFKFFWRYNSYCWF